MKTITQSFPSLLVTVATAALAATGVVASGQSLNAPVLGSILFAAGVAGWTIAQYSRAPRPLSVVPATVAFEPPCAVPVRYRQVRLAA